MTISRVERKSPISHDRRGITREHMLRARVRSESANNHCDLREIASKIIFLSLMFLTLFSLLYGYNSVKFVIKFKMIEVKMEKTI